MARLRLGNGVVEVPDHTVEGLTQMLGSREQAAAVLRAAMDLEYRQRMMAAVHDPSALEWTPDMAKMAVGMHGIRQGQAPPAPSQDWGAMLAPLRNMAGRQ